MTFSIVGRCPRSGMVGAAVCSAVPSIGGLTVFGKAGVGAIATQSLSNPYLAIDGLKLLVEGKLPQAVVEELLRADPAREKRQVSIIDVHGNVAGYTGHSSVPWFGHTIAEDCVAAANMMTDETTVAAMVEEFDNNRDLDLELRLLRALEAGDATGADFRGRQSTCLLVYGIEEYPYRSIRVDEHKDPVGELRRIYKICERQLFPLIDMLPTRENPGGTQDVDRPFIQMLLKSPEER